MGGNGEGRELSRGPAAQFSPLALFSFQKLWFMDTKSDPHPPKNNIGMAGTACHLKAESSSPPPFLHPPPGICPGQHLWLEVTGSAANKSTWEELSGQ